MHDIWIQVLALETHKKVAGLNQLIGSQLSLLHNWMSNGNTYIKCGAQQRYFDWFQAYFANRGHCGHDRMVVGCCEFESRSGWGVQRYVIKFVSDFDRLVVFSGSSGFLHQKNWPSHTRYNWNIVSSGVKHHPANKQLNLLLLELRKWNPKTLDMTLKMQKLH